MTDRYTIVYITGVGHSGSTLLDLLLGSHPQIVGVGEIGRLAQLLPFRRCTCGAPRIGACTLWQRVEGALRDRGDPPLGELDLQCADPATFASHNHALFRAIAAVNGRRYVVDSSKQLPRLRALLGSGAFDVRPIHLLRSPEGVVYSNVRKHRPWLRHTLSYTSVVRRTHRLLRHHDHRLVRYEDLTRDPAGVVSDLVEWLGLRFDPAQLDWASQEHHNVGGNRMRRRSESVIRLDSEWREGLSPWQKRWIALLTLPASRLLPR